MAITQNGRLAIDDNDKPVMGGTSSVDNATIINSSFDPTTRRLLVDDSGGGASFTVLVPTGIVNGTNRTFTWSATPQVIVLDNANVMNKVSSDTTVNWTGTTTTVLNQAPNFNIFGY